MYIYYFYDEEFKHNCGSSNHYKIKQIAAGREVHEIEIWLYNGWFMDAEWLG